VEAEKERSKEKSSNVFESSEDSSIEFTEEELKRFRKAANFDLEFNDLNKNMTTISDEFVRGQQEPQEKGPAGFA
jgi:hypothetical protein